MNLYTILLQSSNDNIFEEDLLAIKKNLESNDDDCFDSTFCKVRMYKVILSIIFIHLLFWELVKWWKYWKIKQLCKIQFFKYAYLLFIYLHDEIV